MANDKAAPATWRALMLWEQDDSDWLASEVPALAEAIADAPGLAGESDAEGWGCW